MIKELEMVSGGAVIRFPNTEELMHKLNEVIAQVNANTQTIEEFFKDANPAEPTKTYTEDEVAEMLGKLCYCPCVQIYPDSGIRVMKSTDEWCAKNCDSNKYTRKDCWKHALQSGLLKGAEG